MIRVLRILEYTFENPVDAEKHLSRLGVPANGTYRPPSGNMTIRSATVTDFDGNTNIEVVEVPTPPRKNPYPVTVSAYLNAAFADDPTNLLIREANMGVHNLGGPEDRLILNLLLNRDGSLHLEYT